MPLSVMGVWIGKVVEEVLPPQSVAGEKASSVWASGGTAGGVAATTAADRTAREPVGAGGGGGTGPAGV